MPVNETILASAVYDQLKQAMAADRAGLTELYRDYLANAWNTLRSLREAVQQQNAEVASEKAHYLKGSSLVLGARVVAQRAAALQELALNGDARGAEVGLKQIEQALLELQAELSDRLGAGVIPAGSTAA
jgi:HPt (histidine-containing phosphotransfer) domain-containing protein